MTPRTHDRGYGVSPAPWAKSPIPGGGDGAKPRASDLGAMFAELCLGGL
jgi:hypothetical protein